MASHRSPSTLLTWVSNNAIPSWPRGKLRKWLAHSVSSAVVTQPCSQFTRQPCCLRGYAGWRRQTLHAKLRVTLKGRSGGLVSVQGARADDRGDQRGFPPRQGDVTQCGPSAPLSPPAESNPKIGAALHFCTKPLWGDGGWCRH